MGGGRERTHQGGPVVDFGVEGLDSRVRVCVVVVVVSWSGVVDGSGVVGWCSGDFVVGISWWGRWCCESRGHEGEEGDGLEKHDDECCCCWIGMEIFGCERK